MPPLSFQARIEALTESAEDQRQCAILLGSRLTALEEEFQQRISSLEKEFQQQKSFQTEVLKRTCEAEVDNIHMISTEEPEKNTAPQPELNCLDPVVDGGAKVVRCTEQECSDPELMEYTLLESVWDCSLALNRRQVESAGTALFIIALLLNVIVQFFFCWILLWTDDFVPESPSVSRFEKLAEQMYEWRMTEGHSLDHLDLRDVSLVSRVCANDPSLSIANGQESLLAEINSYLNIESDEQFQFHLTNSLPTGSMLAIVCIFYHCMILLGRVREVMTRLLALLMIPRTHNTVFDDIGGIDSISNARLACELVLIGLRIVIALLLLYVGIVWLASTSAITDLILNTAALSFVLDFDLVLFQAIVPSALQRSVVNAAPLKYRRARWNLEAVLPLCFSLAIVLFVTCTLLKENVNSMALVKKNLCDGNTDFVAETNAMGIVNARQTSSFGETETNVLKKYEVQAVAEVAKIPKPTRDEHFSLAWWHSSDVKTFDQKRKETMREALQEGYCVDFDNASFTPIFRDSYGFYFNTAREIVDLTGSMSFAQEFNCSEYRSFCDKGYYGIIRFLCPLTCGCSLPTSGLLRSPPSDYGGCASACEEAVAAEIKNAACVDLQVTSTLVENIPVKRGWERYWQSYNDSMRGDSYAAFVAAKISNGCNDTAVDPDVGHGFCDSEETFLKTRGMRSIMAFCPRTCCRERGAATKPADCPDSC
eukprot:TRINITY_DN12164_c0_g2_i1.p1 TRINITY_DN12164_c0_g2~~TRINITY_DN12164_c0_g2_i1.p1  ORF type:complete len:710 (+),score=123.00 TRINITY_DN12164_c0_g2_i1:128-2257(+)